MSSNNEGSKPMHESDSAFWANKEVSAPLTDNELNKTPQGPVRDGHDASRNNEYCNEVGKFGNKKSEWNRYENLKKKDIIHSEDTETQDIYDTRITLMRNSILLNLYWVNARDPEHCGDQELGCGGSPGEDRSVLVGLCIVSTWPRLVYSQLSNEKF